MTETQGFEYTISCLRPYSIEGEVAGWTECGAEILEVDTETQIFKVRLQEALSGSQIAFVRQGFVIVEETGSATISRQIENMQTAGPSVGDKLSFRSTKRQITKIKDGWAYFSEYRIPINDLSVGINMKTNELGWTINRETDLQQYNKALADLMASGKKA